MPTWINVFKWVVPGITESIQALRISGTRHNRIGAEEASQHGRVEAGVVVVQAAQAGLFALAGLCPARV